MDKLTQFVSKSFDNNNISVVCVDNDKSLKLSMTSLPPPENLVKNEEDNVLISDQIRNEDSNDDEKAKPAAKNWLIPDSPKNSPPTYGIDLTLNSSFNSSTNDQGYPQGATVPDGLLKTSPPSPMMRWFERNSDVKSPSPKNGYASSESSPIDLEDSKSCPDTHVSDQMNVNDEQARQSVGTLCGKKKATIADTEKKICSKFSNPYYYNNTAKQFEGFAIKPVSLIASFFLT